MKNSISDENYQVLHNQVKAAMKDYRDALYDSGLREDLHYAVLGFLGDGMYPDALYEYMVAATDTLGALAIPASSKALGDQLGNHALEKLVDILTGLIKMLHQFKHPLILLDLELAKVEYCDVSPDRLRDMLKEYQTKIKGINRKK
jgi:hypothetical protein